MQCPVCSNTLTEKHLDLTSGQNWDDIRVDACEGGCGGLWFDRFELEKLDEAHESAGETLLELEYDASITVDHDAKRRCPKCLDVTMMQRFFSVSRSVEVDECGGCAGIWLDAGELERIRQTFETEEAREEAFEDFYAEEMAPKLESLSQDESSGAVRNVLRFISPSNWFDDA